MEALAHPIPVGAARIGIGKSKFYEEIKAGRINVVHVGKRTLVTEAELQRYLASLEKAAGGDRAA